jgi:hypothetical protein
MSSNNKNNKLAEDIKFCTECDDQLDDFCFSDISKNLEEIKKNTANCKKTGKFKGDFCSKRFIADDDLEMFSTDNVK